MRDLTTAEIEAVNGAILANIGMGIAGAAGAMGAYSVAGGITGDLTGAGFAGAAVGGFVFGAGGFNHVSGTVGVAAGAATKKIVSEC